MGLHSNSALNKHSYHTLGGFRSTLEEMEKRMQKVECREKGCEMPSSRQYSDCNHELLTIMHDCIKCLHKNGPNNSQACVGFYLSSLNYFVLLDSGKGRSLSLVGYTLMTLPNSNG